jgi:hypothetical protein
MSKQRGKETPEMHFELFGSKWPCVFRRIGAKGD